MAHVHAIKQYNQSMMPVAEYTPRGTPGDFKIVKEKRGDLVIGFRVQSCRFRHGDTYWTNVGRRCYSLEQARDLKAWFEDHDIRRTPVDYEDVQ